MPDRVPTNREPVERVDGDSELVAQDQLGVDGGGGTYHLYWREYAHTSDALAL